MAQHLRMPLAVAANGRLAAVDQDSPDDVAQSLGLFLTTRPGERRSVPGYGAPDPLFTAAEVARLTAVMTAADTPQWEPRATPLAVQVAVDGTTAAVTVSPTSSS